MDGLIMFYGRECVHCRYMMPYVEQLEKEMGVVIKKLEVWHNEKNADLMRSFKDIISRSCGGLLGTPSFVNTKTNGALCGEVKYEKLKEWTLGK